MICRYESNVLNHLKRRFDRKINQSLIEKLDRLCTYVRTYAGTNLDVAGSDLGKGPDVEDRGLPGEGLELQRAEPGSVEAEPCRVPERESSEEEEEAVHRPNGEPLEQPHRQPESGDPKYLPG